MARVEEEAERLRLLALASTGRVFLGVTLEKMKDDLATHLQGLAVKAQEQKEQFSELVDEGGNVQGPVVGVEVLEELKQVVRSYMVMSDESLTAAVLWTMYSHVFEVFDISPILVLTSPVKRCGKTKLASVLLRLVHKPEPASNISTAALFHAVEASHPTLVIDEADTFFDLSDDLKGLINSGHTRDLAFVSRMVKEGNAWVLTKFSTFTPKLIALIGRLPDTVMDRGIEAKMRRRLKGEPVRKWRNKNAEELRPLYRRIRRWATDHLEALKQAEPSIPEELDDRAQDNWEPLLAIAELVGGDWPERAREAALKLSGEDARADQGLGVQLLADLRALFLEMGVDRLTSAAVVGTLKEQPERPWGDFKYGKPISQRQLADLLVPFGITSDTVYLGGGREGRQQAKGYYRASLEEAWARYLPPLEGVSIRRTVTPLEPRDEIKFSRSVERGRYTDVENTPNPTPGAAYYGSTDRNPLERRGRGSAIVREPIPVREPVPR